MAEPIGVASGLLTLATFAFQSSRSPYQAIKHFQSLPQDHTEALNRVLLSLGQMAANSDTDLAALRFPLFRYGKAIEDFEGVIIKNIAYSGGPRSRCWDWAKLKYMRDDIVEFGNMQAGFESIISIVLADVSL